MSANSDTPCISIAHTQVNKLVGFPIKKSNQTISKQPNRAVLENLSFCVLCKYGFSLPFKYTKKGLFRTHIIFNNVTTFEHLIPTLDTQCIFEEGAKTLPHQNLPPAKYFWS